MPNETEGEKLVREWNEAWDSQTYTDEAEHHKRMQSDLVKRIDAKLERERQKSRRAIREAVLEERDSFLGRD